MIGDNLEGGGEHLCTFTLRRIISFFHLQGAVKSAVLFALFEDQPPLTIALPPFVPASHLLICREHIVARFRTNTAYSHTPGNIVYSLGLA